MLLQLQGIEKTYGKGSLAVQALKGIDLEIPKGGFHVIVGKSGSGKSTLLHILGALDRPTKGKLFLEGEDVFAKSDREITLVRRRRIGFVFQAFNLLPEYTVQENIMLPAHLDKKTPDADFFERIVGKLGIQDKLRYYPDELSGGQKQRVAIARALITRPAILLADEPTGNVDEKTGTEVIRLLKDSAKEFHQTIVMVTHDMSIAQGADRVIQIVEGRISC
ncbi:MAG: ABC transporter ATP-binding protein [Bacillota bacterium]|nr:ABC transporter ATP-binding protein [Bacillota bacterium]